MYSSPNLKKLKKNLVYLGVEESSHPNMCHSLLGKLKPGVDLGFHCFMEIFVKQLL